MVGALGFVVDFGATALLGELLGLSIVIATGIGFCLGATSNFFINRRWTWKSKDKNVAGQYVKFFAVSLIGLALHYAVFFAWIALFSVEFAVAGYLITSQWIAKVVATGVVMVWNFMANNLYTFKVKQREVELIFATNNKHKVEEVVAALKGSNFRVLTLEQCGIFDDIPETEPTLEGNARLKARFVAGRMSGRYVFADDTGLEVKHLDGRPGVLSARYSGRGTDGNIDKILEEMAGVANRDAQFRTAICLIEPSGIEHIFEGIVRGEILESREGDDGFGYDPIFRPEGYSESFAVMSLESKNEISHRGRAIAMMAKWLTKE